MSYSPWGHKETDRTERLKHTHTHTHTHIHTHKRVQRYWQCKVVSFDQSPSYSLPASKVVHNFPDLVGEQAHVLRHVIDLNPTILLNKLMISSDFD